MKLAKGLRIIDLRVGGGRIAEKGTVAIVHISCFLNRGDKLYSTHDGRGIPAQFEVGKRRAFVAVDQAVVGMREGGRRRVTVGPHLTYYERQRFPNLPDDALLRYEIELENVRDDWDTSWTKEYEAP